MNKYAIAFDIGGNFIKSAALTAQGRICPETVAVFPSFAHLGKEELIDRLMSLIRFQANCIADRNASLYGIGYAFPGPFDYENGISYLTGLDKFERLYGVNLREALTRRLEADTALSRKLEPEFRIVFDNDANLFAQGEWLTGKASSYRRLIAVTLGTGTGSAFMDNGLLIKERSDVPPNGWIYSAPFGESIVDDYLSKRGLLRLAALQGLDMTGRDVKELAELSRSGDAQALRVFRQFGRQLGEALNLFAPAFRAEAVILGGQIAKCSDLFLDGAYERLLDRAIVIEVSKDTSLSAFAGVARLLLAK
ncbi:ROK family protein [Paenibacillus sp. HB172176]|uniref:ROK family protein n=1 Tax=Paenibacillus sp. HB172176 TaxID=2493690 RepID=UPI00143B7F2C|nr:ROK family protein [Paenibacillus sp. HB172176]